MKQQLICILSSGGSSKYMVRATKMKQRVIPKFSNEAAEAAWWDAHRSEIEAEIRKRMKKKPTTLGDMLRGAIPSQPITLRISQEDLAEARRLAARRGLGYQTYIKMLLRQALASDSAEDRRKNGHASRPVRSR